MLHKFLGKLISTPCAVNDSVAQEKIGNILGKLIFCPCLVGLAQENRKCIDELKADHLSVHRHFAEKKTVTNQPEHSQGAI